MTAHFFTYRSVQTIGSRKPPAVTFSGDGKTGPIYQSSTRSKLRGGIRSDMGCSQETTLLTSGVVGFVESGRFPRSLSASTLSSSLSLFVDNCGLSRLVEAPGSFSFRRVSNSSIWTSGFGWFKNSSKVPCQDSKTCIPLTYLTSQRPEFSLLWPSRRTVAPHDTGYVQVGTDITYWLFPITAQFPSSTLFALFPDLLDSFLSIFLPGAVMEFPYKNEDILPQILAADEAAAA